MGILDNVERGLERAVNGAFARTFRSGVQPVEIASALKRELDIGAVIVDRDRVGPPLLSKRYTASWLAWEHPASEGRRGDGFPTRPS